MKSPEIRLRPWPAASAGLSLGASAGALEMFARIALRQEPEAIRRASVLISYGAIVYALLCAGFLLLFLLLLRTAGAFGWRAADGSGGRLFACSLCGTAVACLLLVVSEAYLWRAPLPGRIAALALSVVLAAGGALAASIHPPRAVASAFDRLLGFLSRPARPVAAALLALASIAVFTLLLLGGHERALARRTSVQRAGGGIPPPNILMIVVDTLRADSVSCYRTSRAGDGSRSADASEGDGDAEPPRLGTPVMDRLASEGVLFEDVVAPSSWTLPSVATLLTSTPPREHGYVDFHGEVAGSLPSLPGVLASAGYECSGLSGNPLMHSGRGLSNGFDFYDVYNFEMEGRLAASRVLRAAARLSGLLGAVEQADNPILWLGPLRPPFLATRLSFDVLDEELNDRLFRYGHFASGRPQFIYVQYFAPHYPYLEHPGRFLERPLGFSRQNLQPLRRLYEAEVAYTDQVLGNLLDRLKEAGLLEGAIVLVTADHGEEFLEHGNWRHGHSLYQEVLRVPLIVRAPGLPRGLGVKQRVELLDVAPTLLDLAGLPAVPLFKGRSLAALAHGDETSYTAQPIYSELTSRFLNPRNDFLSVIDGDLKIVRKRNPSRGLVRDEVYDLRSDPSELHNLADPAAGPAEHGETDRALAVLRQRLDLLEQSTQRPKAATLSAEELQRLRALGYIK